MQRLAMTIATTLSGLPGLLLAHGGLDHSSVLLVFLHGMAHAITDHSLVAALLGATVVVALSMHHRRRARRRASP